MSHVLRIIQILFAGIGRIFIPGQMARDIGRACTIPRCYPFGAIRIRTIKRKRCIDFRTENAFSNRDFPIAFFPVDHFLFSVVLLRQIVNF